MKKTILTKKEAQMNNSRNCRKMAKEKTCDMAKSLQNRVTRLLCEYLVGMLAWLFVA